MGGCFCGRFPTAGSPGSPASLLGLHPSSPTCLGPGAHHEDPWPPLSYHLQPLVHRLPRHPAGPGERSHLGKGKGTLSLPRFPLSQFMTRPEQGARSPCAPEAEAGGFTGLFQMCCSHPFLHSRKNTWRKRGKINCLLNCFLVSLFQRKKHNCKHGKGIEQLLSF